MNDMWENRGIAPPFMTLALDEVSGRLDASATPPPEITSSTQLGGPQS
jgi:hypothetical protein